MRVLIRVAYDGTEYSGWQIQPNAVTIEEKLIEALQSLFGEEVKLIGASRTDAGVHALGNVGVFDVDTRIPAEKIAYAMNARLPEDIRVVESIEVASDFHPRHCDCEKTYEYSIWNDTFENPLCTRYAHFFYRELNLELMKEAAGHIVGTHDFTSFCAAASQVEDKTRTVYSVDIEKKDKLITIRVRGNGFLYNMVRIIAGTLINVGSGLMSVEEVKKAVEGQNRALAGPTAPAKGLKLVKIDYIDNIFEKK